MAYTGFVSTPDFARKDLDQVVTGRWIFNPKERQSGETPITGNEYDYIANGKWKFNQEIEGTSVYAKWGDLAEVYEADKDEVLVPGTLVKFGGKKEITKTRKNDHNVFGVISTKPGVVLNKQVKNGEKVALVGKVPVRVIGKINKFDKLTTSYIPGVAKKKTLLDTLLFKPTIGRCLQTNTSDKEKLVNVFVKTRI